jgi:hypothetical protein
VVLFEDRSDEAFGIVQVPLQALVTGGLIDGEFNIIVFLFYQLTSRVKTENIKEA